MGNSTLVDSQSWRMVEAANYRIEQQETQQQQIKRQIASQNLIGTKQQMAKDVVLPAALAGEGATSLKGTKTGSQEAFSPKLPPPQEGEELNEGLNGSNNSENYFMGLSLGSTNQNIGLIAIIGAVLALQAKCNSNFWSTQWKQTCASMLQQVSFAPLIAEATESAANYQADATKQQATQEEIDGTINLTMFGAAVAMGAFMEIKNPEEDLTNQDTKLIDQTKTPANSEQPLQQESQQAARVQKSIQTDSESFGSKFKALAKNLLNKQKMQSGFTGFLAKLGNATQTLNMAAQGSTSMVNNHYLSLQATDQQSQGVEEALSKQEESYQGFYGQAFSQGTDLAQGSAQNLDYAMNILKSISDTISGTVRSMFQG